MPQKGATMTETLRYAAVMLTAGIGIPLLAALNAQLGLRIGAPVAAAVVLFAVALLSALIALAFFGGADRLRLVPAQPKHLFFAGCFVAFYVISITMIAPRFGVGNAIFCVLLGQMIAAATIDHFGLIGAVARPITLLRASGIGLMTLGLLLIQRG